MPLYEYHCPRCRRRTEVLQRIGEGGEQLRCPQCEQVGLERKLSTFASGGRSSRLGGSAAPSCTGFT